MCLHMTHIHVHVLHGQLILKCLYDTYSPLLANIKQRAMPGAAKQWLSADHWKLVRTSNISGYTCNSRTKQYIKVISNCQYKTTNFTFFRINEGHNLSSGTIKGTIT